MSVHKPSKLYGIDFQIAELQDYIYAKIGVSTGFEVYGRIRKTERSGKFIPEAISGNEYSELFVNDTLKGVVGFYVKDVRQNSPIPKAEVEIIWTVNIEQIIGEANDEKMLLIIEKILSDYPLEITKIKTGVQEVFRDFDKDSIRYRDMMPYMIISFTAMIEYYNNITNLTSNL